MPRNPTGQLVEREFLTLAVWDQLDRVTCTHVALALENCLPEPWTFQSLFWYECGGQKRWVAFFTWKKPGRFQEATFALIPGSEVELGYDPKRPPNISQTLIDEWEAEYLELYEHDERSWLDTLRESLSPLRTVTMQPFLIETIGQPIVRNTGASERKRIQSQGMRLPTADEWEYACSAGTRTLWHWGDNPELGPKQMNAFGLHIGQDRYAIEPLEAGTEYRGGDAGNQEDGRMHILEQMRVISSWFRYSNSSNLEDSWEHMRWRRVFPLPPEILG